MKRTQKKKREKGQSIVEFSLMLPILLVMFIGMVEVGSLFYDYLILAVANREGVRFSSRGRFDYEDVAERVVAAGGGRQVNEPAPHIQHNLRTTGPDANFGMIITNFPFDENGELERDDEGKLRITTYVTGTIVTGDGQRRPITPDDSRIDIGTYPDLHGDITRRVNEMRKAEEFDPQATEIVVVETFLAHNILLPGVEIINFPNPTTLYFSSSMRVLRDRSSTTQ
ncbi:MAG: TadE family protein [Anaerolineae bacterium]